MQNNHIPVMLEEVLAYIPSDKKINVIDATFGGGSYSKSILKKFNVNKLIAIDRDPISKILAEDLIKNFNNFSLINGCFSRIDSLIFETENQNIKYASKEYLYFKSHLGYFIFFSSNIFFLTSKLQRQK